MDWIKELYSLPLMDELEKTINAKDDEQSRRLIFGNVFDAELNKLSYAREHYGGGYIFLGKRNSFNYLDLGFNRPDHVFPEGSKKLKGHQPRHAIVTRPENDVYFHPKIKEIITSFNGVLLETIKHDPNEKSIDGIIENLRDKYQIYQTA